MIMAANRLRASARIDLVIYQLQVCERNADSRIADVRRVRARWIALTGGAIQQRHHSEMLVGESNRGNSDQMVRVSKRLVSSVAVTGRGTHDQVCEEICTLSPSGSLMCKPARSPCKGVAPRCT